MASTMNQHQLMEGLNADGTYLGTIIATTVKDQSNTASPFTTVSQHDVVMVQPDAACYVDTASTAAAGTLTSANGIYLEANEKYYMRMSKGAYIMCLAVTGTVNLKVRRLARAE